MMNRISTQCLGGLCAVLGFLTMLMGCATTSQVQHFMVRGERDPVTGEPSKAFYRMTVDGQASMLSRYNLRATYVSASTIDSLNGKLPRIPEADLTPANEKTFNDIKQIFLERLEADARAKGSASVAPSGASSKEAEREEEAQLMYIARKGWFSSLSDSDLLSVGDLKTTNPFIFRKLVFYAAGTSIDLKQYETEITSAIEKTATLARHLKDMNAGVARPGDITNLRSTPVDRSSVTLTWDNPLRPPIAGALVTKRLNDAAQFKPQDSTEYVVNATVANGTVTVVAYLNGNTATAKELIEGKKYAIDVFPFNEKKQYGPPSTIVVEPSGPPAATAEVASATNVKAVKDGAKAKVTFTIPTAPDLVSVVVVRAKQPFTAAGYKAPFRAGQLPTVGTAVENSEVALILQITDGTAGNRGKEVNVEDLSVAKGEYYYFVHTVTKDLRYSTGIQQDGAAIKFE